MSTPPNLFNYHFYAVGQGLFSAGSLHRTRENVSRFQWVYDCGTTSSQVLIDHAIAGLEAWSGPRRQLDLAVLSHFDDDHISGICHLISKFPVKTLLLPYMSLAERLVIAFEEGVPAGDELMSFFINPAEYLTNVEGANIERVLFVLPSTGEGPPLSEGGPAINPQDGDGLDITFRPSKPDDYEELQSLQLGAGATSPAHTEIAFMGSGSAITLRALWEFVPYNDDPVKPIPADFRQNVSRARERLKNGPSREVALATLKDAYDKAFGDDSKERNFISLFLYAGPIYPTWQETSLWAASNGASKIRAPFDGRCSILYTGDGYLDSQHKLDRMTRYLRPQRINRAGVLQVMHHGASDNCFKGVAIEIAPSFSVFSSDPNHGRLKHPRADVLRDFYERCPLRVDKAQSATISGWMIAPFDTPDAIHELRDRDFFASLARTVTTAVRSEWAQHLESNSGAKRKKTNGKKAAAKGRTAQKKRTEPLSRAVILRSAPPGNSD